MTSDEERRAAAFAHATANAPPSDAGPCLDAGSVAAFVEGSLPADERAAVVRHLGDCGACLEWVGALERSGAVEVAAGRPARAIVRPRFAAAVAAAVVMVAATFLWWTFGPASEATHERMIAALPGLRAAHAGLFDDFRTLTPEELAGGDVPIERGGIDELSPRGALPDGRPTLSWRAVPGAEKYRVRVRADDGSVLLERETTHTRLAWPADAPPIPDGASCVWRVAVEGAVAQSAGSVAVNVLRDPDRTRYETGLAAIASTAPRGVRSALAAHWALRFDLVAEAARILEPAEGDATGVERDTLAHVRRRLGVAGENARR